MWLCNRLSRAANPKAPLSSDETVSYVREITFSCLKVSKCPRIAMNYRVTGSNSSLTNKLLHQSCVSCWTVDEASVRGVLFLPLGWIVCLWSFCCRGLTRPHPTTTTLSAFSPHFLCDASVTCLTCLPVIVPQRQTSQTHSFRDETRDEIISTSGYWLLVVFLHKSSSSDVGPVITGRR